ncbi:4-demethylwyosine synthase TYW1 [Candidatus Woesearchaeota archaeon]|nr:4-demethylwyosine synthase TYW1 [Candidatus Woesearchaeota archaeon]
MLDKESRAKLEKQQYRIVGSHSAVKVCGWTKNMITGKGGCYKLKFYGIMSHQCLQMTTSISCANRCVFCWRDYKAPVSKDWIWDIDEPEFILEGSLHAQKKLLEGYNGNEKAIKKAFEQSNDPKHVALSLTGEPIMYPKLNELLDLFNERGISTFLVTNAQHATELAQLHPVTQLYLSVDAPNKELLKEIDKPLYPDFWERFNQSLEETAKKKARTAIRITVMSGLNDSDPKGYAKLIKQADIDFVEVKAYMHIGESRNRMKRDHMPVHNEIVAFARTLAPFLEDYELMMEHKPSRVVLFTHKRFKKDDGWHTWIDFEKNKEVMLNNTGDINALDYCRKTPEQFIGLVDEDNKMVDGRSIYLRKNDEETGFLSVCETGEETELDE